MSSPTLARYIGRDVVGVATRVLFVMHARDLALARRVRRGDAEAETELLERVLPALRAVARAILGTGADADDAVQIGLMRVLDKLASYRGDASLERWCRTVGVRVCLRLSAQNRRHGHAVDPEDESLGLASEVEIPTDTLAVDVEQYLARISEAQREALVLHHALDYSVPEIAELLGVPTETVKSRLAFGRRALRKLIVRERTIAESPAAKRGAHGRG